MRPTTRNKILKKFNHKCAQCSATERLEIDHIIPLAVGGRDDEDNLQVLCKTCNLRKGRRFPYMRYFDITESPNYISIRRDFPISINSKLFQRISFTVFKNHADYWNL